MKQGNGTTHSIPHNVPFRRIVILSDYGSPWLNAVTAVTCATLPCLSALSNGWCEKRGNVVVASKLDSPRVLIPAEAGVAPDGTSCSSLSSLSAVCRDLADGSNIASRIFFTADAASNPRAQTFAPSVEDDLFVYVSAWSAEKDAAHLALRSLSNMFGATSFGIGASGVLTGPCGVPRLIILADESTRNSVCETARHLSNWCVLSCIVPSFAPPAFNHQLAASVVRECDVVCGVLECVALGVALGTVKRLPFGFMDPVCVMPLDAAISTALIAFLQRLKGGPAAVCGGTSATIIIGSPSDSAFVWGMFAQYLMDYYGRVGLLALKESQLRWLFDTSPALQLNADFMNWVNYGTSTMMPFRCYYDNAAARRRKQLMEHYPHSNVARKVCGTLTNIDTRIHNMVKLTQHSEPTGQHDGERVNKQGKPNTAGFYSDLLRAVEQDVALRPLYPYISLSCIRWDVFVKVIAQSVLEHAARQIAGHPTVVPPPLPLYHNDIIFYGPQRAPRNCLLTRFFPESVRWAQRSGLRPNGVLVAAEPGLTEESLACILQRPSIIQVVKKTAKAEGVTEEDVLRRATAILRGMGDNLNQLNVRVFGLMVRKALFRLFDRVSLNASAFERLHAATTQPRTHVMLLPAHRSYIDFIIMTYLLLVMGLTLPHVCAGDDFLRMGQITKLMRGSGAFFIRRTFRDDPLYTALFKEYIHNLVLRKQMIEFFIEGTRSRTGKTQRPMLGVLKFIADTLVNAQEAIDDACILPVSLSYDELLETKLYAAEQLGLSKPRESVGNLVRASSVLSRRHGKIHVHVAEPLSLRSFCHNPSQCPEGFEPVTGGVTAAAPNKSSDGEGARSPSHIPKQVLTNIAWHVTHTLQDNTIITPTALLAAVLGTLSPPAGCMSLREAQAKMLWLRDHIIRRRAHVSEDCVNNNGEELSRMALFHLAEFVETRVEAGETWVAMRQDSRAPLGVAICSNQLIHVFVDEGVVALVARASGELSDNKKTARVSTDLLKRECELLRTLLAGEFQDYLPWCPYTYASWFKYAVTRLLAHDDIHNDGTVTLEGGGSAESTNKVKKGDPYAVASEPRLHDSEDIVIHFTRRFRFITGILYPFVESLYVVSVAVAAVAETHVEHLLRRRPLLLACQKWALELCNEKRLVVHIQSCGSVALKSAFTSIMEFIGLKSRTEEKDLVYILPIPPNGLETQLQPVTEQLKKLLRPLIKVKEEEEREARNHMVNVYKKIQMSSKRASRM
ncbi:dihydroxyacetone phosphate acyltransferase,putative [Trypanosoma brucei gambiense DAL972]|uniref:Glycerol-3-phosphate acyltransferase, putative n=1 Tax=Trypanosoma brucei gambiense (strain MHOM/CI/86/DAL972) TaxID=679716 RepID=C9ZMW3_TRYB9|nr:dihydroxyacetone phosphate acyltransferase,putative [Trypanosoma brucei gambiense DAL972]CBH10616.1 dihydroxyacetone phosphate acyltransferase,putative [Trypanosoma brucei gambiense DAL972]|eukprot:XP_011772905.1 dihydroxyacetone phosphate acyltransferase,putative [Trypanosoma brucei gambiense DAL972]